MLGKEYFGFLFSPVYSIWAVYSVYATVRVGPVRLGLDLLVVA
jgi:hypothetical protein